MITLNHLSERTKYRLCKNILFYYFRVLLINEPKKVFRAFRIKMTVLFPKWFLVSDPIFGNLKLSFILKTKRYQNIQLPFILFSECIGRSIYVYFLFLSRSYVENLLLSF